MDRRLLVLLGGLAACRGAPDAPGSFSYVGMAGCVGCHPGEVASWRASHHALATQEASASSVLGDFRGAEQGPFAFSQEGGHFFAATKGMDRAARYEVTFTLGVYPLQQYLVAFPEGRLQVLPLAWDARPASVGGQKWFRPPPPEEGGEIADWKGPDQNWNFMCAECHSTHVTKGFNASRHEYQTRFSDLSVACEACHGPASGHVSWAEAVGRMPGNRSEEAKGFGVRLSDPSPGRWEMDPRTGIAKRSTPRGSDLETETCARCHSRRAALTEPLEAGRGLLETHRLPLLEEGLYFADGQQQGEVYEYGSFLESRMHRMGVGCTDCHDPHGLKVSVPPDRLCERCHLPAKFASPAHHHHRAGSQGSSCVECHMPSRVYMGVDGRRDHSFRIPRPDLSEKLKAPNACNVCHVRESASWAAGAADRFWGRTGRYGGPHFGEAIELGRLAGPGAVKALAAVASDGTQAGIVRATSLELLGRLGAGDADKAVGLLQDPDPLVRLGAVRAVAALRPGALLPLLEDPVRMVRIEAARDLAGSPSVKGRERASFEAAIHEWRAWQLLNPERAESHLNLGALAAATGQQELAEMEDLEAIRILPSAAAGYLQLAEVSRTGRGQDAGDRVLRQGLAALPGNPLLEEALGIALLGEGKNPEALSLLRGRFLASPTDAECAWAYGLALESSGRGDEALSVLRGAEQQHPENRDLLLALSTLYRDRGDKDHALFYARALVEVSPGNPEAKGLLQSLEGVR